MSNAVIYARISLDRRNREGTDRQIEQCRKLAELHGYDVTAEFIDPDVSAYSGKHRPEYEKLLDFIRAGQTDRVYVYSVDRLARRTRDLLDYLDVCKPRRVTTWAITGEGLDPGSANTNFVTTILGAVAEQESAHKAERVRAAMEQRAAKGKPRSTGRRMFGYESDGKTIIESEAAALRDAADRLLRGESLRSIVKAMNAAGHTTTLKNNPMDTVSLRTILKNPRIAGLSTWTPSDASGQRRRADRVIVADGTWPPILSREVWEAVTAVLANPARTTNRTGNTPQTLLTGLMTCACGQPMYRRSRTYPSGETRGYYACKRETPPPHVTIEADGSETYIEWLIINTLSANDAREVLDNQADSATGERAAAAATERAALTDRLAALEDQAVAGNIDAASFARMSARLTEAAAQLDAELAALTATDDGRDVVAGLQAQGAEAWWERADLEARRRLIRMLMAITVAPGKPGAKQFDARRLVVEWKAP